MGWESPEHRLLEFLKRYRAQGVYASDEPGLILTPLAA